jgi:hypothetical protein
MVLSCLVIGLLKLQHLTSSEPANGFRALRLLDSNGDGYISSLDEIFPRLNLWFDRNHNGVGDEGESVALSNLVQSSRWTTK